MIKDNGWDCDWNKQTNKQTNTDMYHTAWPCCLSVNSTSTWICFLSLPRPATPPLPWPVFQQIDILKMMVIATGNDFCLHLNVGNVSLIHFPSALLMMAPAFIGMSMYFSIVIHHSLWSMWYDEEGTNKNKCLQHICIHHISLNHLHYAEKPSWWHHQWHHRFSFIWTKFARIIL